MSKTTRHEQINDDGRAFNGNWVAVYLAVGVVTLFCLATLVGVAGAVLKP